MITTADAVKHFKGTLCYGCDGQKESQRAVCAGCHKLLPTHMQKNLYRRFGAGYERAYEEAVRCIRARREKVITIVNREVRRKRSNERRARWRQ